MSGAFPNLGESAGGIGGLLAVQEASDPNAPYVFCYDGNGNVTQVAQDIRDPVLTVSAKLKARYEYDPYGNIVGPNPDGNDVIDPNEAGPYAAANTFRFSTKQWDDATGFGYWGMRYYMPRVGRWMSRDPIGENGGMSLFRYSWGDPIEGADPLGLSAGPIDRGGGEAGYGPYGPRPRFGGPSAPPRPKTSPYPPGDPRANFDFAECFKECMALCLVKTAFVPGPQVPVTAASIALYCVAECETKKELGGCGNEQGGRSPCGTKRKMASFWVDCPNGSEARLEWEECDCGYDRMNIRGYYGVGIWTTKWRRVTDCFPCVRGESKPGPRRDPESFNPGAQVP